MKRLIYTSAIHPCTSAHGIIAVLLAVLLFLSPLTSAQQPSDSNSDELNSSNVSPSMAVIVIVLVLAFFITGCASIYIQQCAESSSSSSIPIVIGGGQSRRGQSRGLEKAVIDAFPMFLYSAVKELKIGKGSLECAVCLNEFEDDETLKLLPKCDHVFHPDCIDAWLVGHTTCPVCRANLIPDSAESAHPIDSEGSSSEMPNSDEDPRYEVQIVIGEELETAAKTEETVNNPNRKFPRSNTTGHSLSRPAEDWERFTLRLPAEVRRQVVARARLKRATSMVALPRETSTRRGYRGGEGSGSSRYGRLFNFIRSTTTRKVADDGSVTAGNAGQKRFVGSSVTPLESLPPLPV